MADMMEQRRSLTPEEEPLNQDASPKGKKNKRLTDGIPKLCTEIIEGVKINPVFSACVAVNFVLIFAVLGVTAAWFSFADTEIVDFYPASNLYCLKCEFIKDQEDKKKFFGETDNCCSNEDGKYLEHVISKYVNKTLNEEFREKPLFQLCLNSSTATHPVAMGQIKKIHKLTPDANNILHLVYWDETGSPPFKFFQNVEYLNNGNFKVKRSGYYHIYSNIVYSLKVESGPVFPVVIRHLVLKFRKDYDVGEKLLEGYSTQCQALNETRFTSFVFGDFYITDTDKVQVLVNVHTNLVAEDAYFGMYLI